MLFRSDVVVVPVQAVERHVRLELVDHLLAGSNLTADHREDGILIRGRSDARQADATASEPSSDIVVTGSRIRGAPSASPTIVLSQTQIEDAGQTTVADALRALPQNYGGGQNPGVAGGGDQGGNQNINSASTINLRGLGADATLTLINGHRVAYDSIVQGVDIGSIPLAALDRVEVVTDGSSALYGSDAVAGVANIILKRDFSGLDTSALIGGATSGGRLQQQYGVVGGDQWGRGGVMAAVQYAHDTALNAGDRAMTSGISPSTTLYPAQKQTSVVVTGHQDIGATVKFDGDLLFSRRSTATSIGSDPDSAYYQNGTTTRDKVTSFSASPRFTFALGSDWEGTLSGTFGEDITKGHQGYFAGGAEYYGGDFRYLNRFWGGEAGADGTVVRLPGGPLRVAIGAGYRNNRLTVRLVDVTGETFVPATRTNYYAFGEASVPIVSPDMAIPAIHSLKASAAFRYERYPGTASLTTPKLGLIYAPTADIDLKASWGRSFKAPTLFQQYYLQQSYLVPAADFGYAGSPTAAVLERFGGNPDLKPETANSLVLSATLHPKAVPGLRLEVSAFRIRYKNRIIEPVRSDAGLLDDPSYQDLITLDPSPADQAAIIADSHGGLSNFTGYAYDPGNVVAVVDNRNHNAESQRIKGLDFAGHYELPLGTGRLAVDLSASYLHSRQQLGPDQPTAELAGLIFNPPHWRGRGGITWSSAEITAAAFFNYIGSVRDQRFGGDTVVGSMAPVDLSFAFHPTGSGLVHGFTVRLSALNVLNERPARIETGNSFDPTYDSTNYSIVGRFLSFSIEKKW